MRPFQHFSCTDLDHVWNSRLESVSQSVHPWEISVYGFASPKKLPGILGGVLVTSVHLKRHNFGWQESFREIVDTTRMCLLYLSFDGGCIVWLLQPPPPNTGHSIVNTTHPFNGPLSGTTRVSWYQKGKTNLDFTGARDSEWQWHQLGHMQVCTSLQTDNHASTSLLSFYRPDALPAAQPTVSKHWRHKTQHNTTFDNCQQ